MPQPPAGPLDFAHPIPVIAQFAHSLVEQRGVLRGYAARVDYTALSLPLTAFVAIRPLDPSQADDAPDRLAGLAEIEACYSVAGEDHYLLLVRVQSPADLERLLNSIRAAANVTTRTTVVLSTAYEGRPPKVDV